MYISEKFLNELELPILQSIQKAGLEKIEKRLEIKKIGEEVAKKNRLTGLKLSLGKKFDSKHPEVIKIVNDSKDRIVYIQNKLETIKIRLGTL